MSMGFLQVRQIKQFGGDEWWSAQAIDEEPDMILAELLHRRTFPDGSDRVWLQRRDEGRTWR